MLFWWYLAKKKGFDRKSNPNFCGACFVYLKWNVKWLWISQVQYEHKRDRTEPASGSLYSYTQDSNPEGEPKILCNFLMQTNGPQSILSPMTNGAQKFGTPGQMVLRIFCLSRGYRLWGSGNTGTKLVGDHLSWGTKFWETICPWGPNLMGIVCPGGPNWLGTICPWGQNFWGPFVHGNRIGWGLFVQRDQ